MLDPDACEQRNALRTGKQLGWDQTKNVQCKCCAFLTAHLWYEGSIHDVSSDLCLNDSQTAKRVGQFLQGLQVVFWCMHLYTVHVCG